MSNPLTDLGFEIPFRDIGAEHVEPATDSLLASAEQAIRAIVDHGNPRTYANTLQALEDATDPLERAMAVVGHLESVATTDAFRAAYNAAVPKVSAFWSSLAMNEDLYRELRKTYVVRVKKD